MIKVDNYLKVSSVINDNITENNCNGFNSDYFNDLTELKIIFADKKTCELFDGECYCKMIKKSGWKEFISKYSPDVFLLSSNAVIENSDNLLWLSECADFCKLYGVKIVFWDNLTDKRKFNLYIQFAKKADSVFCVSLENLSFYKSECGISNVFFLPYGARRGWINLDYNKLRENEMCFLSSVNDESTEYIKNIDDILNGFNNKIIFTADKQYSFKYKKIFDGGNKHEKSDISNIKFGCFYDFYRYGMFVPEEVFKIIASGALAVGNKSSAVRTFFGDSVLTQENENDFNYINALSNDSNYLEKIAVLAYRRLLSEHLYKDRLKYIFEKTYGFNINNSIPCIEVFCFASSLIKAKRVVEMFLKQSINNKKLTVILQDAGQCSIEGIRFLSKQEANSVTLGEISNNGYFTVFSEDDYYGENYLTDMMLPFKVNDNIIAVTKDIYFRNEGNKISETDKPDECEISKSVVKAKHYTDCMLGELLNLQVKEERVSVNKYNYCKNYSGLECDIADDTKNICEGKNLNSIYSLSNDIKTYNGMFYSADIPDFYHSVRFNFKAVSCSINNGILHLKNLKSFMSEIISTKKISIEKCSYNGYIRATVFGNAKNCSFGIHVYNKNGKALSTKKAILNTPVIIKTPENADFIRVSIILDKFKSCDIRKIVLGDEFGLSASLIKCKELSDNTSANDESEKFNICIDKPEDVFIKLKNKFENNKNFRDIRFACIMNPDEYKKNYSDFNSVFISGKNFQQELKNTDLLIVEYSAEPYELSIDNIAEIMEFYSINSVPIVLICKKICEFSAEFLRLGNMANYIFTVDINVIPDYKKIFNLNDVYLFAPAIDFKTLNLFSEKEINCRDDNINNISDIQKSSFFLEDDMVKLVKDVGNVDYSRALRVFFGDLVTIGGNIIDDKKRQLALLRKISEEFLYEYRLQYIYSKVFRKDFKVEPECAEVFGFVKDREEAQKIIASFNRQSYENKHLNLVCDFDLKVDESISIIRYNTASNINANEIIENGFGFVFSSKDYYGKNYIKDLALILKNTDYSGIGKNQFFDCDFNISDGKSYLPVENINLTRAGFKSDALKNISVSQLNDLTLNGEFVSSDIFNYCRDYTENECKAVDDEVIAFKGKDCKNIEVTAEKLCANREYKLNIYAKDFYIGFLNNSNVSVNLNENDILTIKNTDEKNPNQFIHCGKKLMISDCPIKDKKIKIRFNGSKKGIKGYVTFYDSKGEKIDYVFFSFNVYCNAVIPENCHYIKFSIKIDKTACCTFSSVNIRQIDDVECVFIPKNGTAVLTNQYPSEENLYSNMFVHKRVLGYKSEGFDCDVISIGYKNPENAQRIYDSIDITEGNYQLLNEILKSDEIKTLCIHFINEEVWQIVKKYKHKLNIFMWCNGYEIEPWWRRSFAYRDDELERQKNASDSRMKMWRDIFSCQKNDNIIIVFVSKFLRDIVFEDYDITLSEDKYKVIHNYIDTDTFNYVPKDISQRTKIMSVKSYLSAVYANDITAKAILELSKTDIFDKLEFDLYGDGPLFDECNKDIMCFKNVHFHRGFIDHSEIARLHKEHGIYLATTRSDTQGVSRDEAMSSGLVPIANAVCAIPEFVDENCGILVPGEDYKGVAKGIIDLYNNPEMFLRLSENAAKRVRSQTSKEYTIDEEIELIKSIEKKL